MLRKEILADFGLLLAALSWGLNFVITKDALAECITIYLCKYEISIIAVIMVIIFPKKLKQITREDLNRLYCWTFYLPVLPHKL